MSEQQRDDTGRFSEKVSERDILGAFDAADSPVLTAPDLADELGMSRQAITYRLKRMREAGVVDRMKAGANAVVWWATGNTRARRGERDPEDVIDTLETFLGERDVPEPPLPSTDSVREDYHARRHRENLERLASDGS